MSPGDAEGSGNSGENSTGSFVPGFAVATPSAASPFHGAHRIFVDSLFPPPIPPGADTKLHYFF